MVNADDRSQPSRKLTLESATQTPPSERDALTERHKGMIGDGRYLLYTIYYSKGSRLLLTTG